MTTHDLTGKVILITGATEGIGKAAAKAFAKRGASLTIVGRNRQKTQETLDELKRESGNDDIAMLICDLSRLADIKRAADEFKATHTRLDVLANNAGAMFKTPSLGPDGYELTFALNHLAYFQMTTALLDLIKGTPSARVVSTSSAMQGRGKLDLDKTPTDLTTSGMGAYATSKLTNILFTKELQRRLTATGQTANCFHPGSVRTKFGAFSTDLGFLFNIIFRLAAPFSKTPEQGADTLVWLATSPEAASLKGEYMTNRRQLVPNKQALDPKLATDLWSLSERLCAEALGKVATEKRPLPKV